MIRTSPSSTDAGAAAPVAGSICPYLLAADGGWRASTPAREHRCTAVVPATILAADKQRRLCLVASHTTCATYLAASGIVDQADPPQDGRRDRVRPGARPVVRTTPLVLDHGRVNVSIPSLRGGRGFGQVGLIGLMALAFAAILLARIPPAGVGTPRSSGTTVQGGAAASPVASTKATIGPTERPIATVAPTRTLVPTEAKPTPTPGASSAPVDAPSSYRVKRGDTLSGIAGKFGTTWQVLAELNGIKDPARLKVGQVLELP